MNDLSFVPDAPPKSTAHAMAKVALGLSIVAFVVPLGIAALVLGHMAEKRMEPAPQTGNGNAMARAALWIAYLQLAFITIAALMTWGMFHETVEGFRRDAMVQRVFRASDQMQPLDAESAREEEVSALNMMNQIMAIEEQMRKHREDRGYVCELYGVLENGAEDSTDAEKRAFGQRVLQSPYMFRISNCNPIKSGIPEAAYLLTAVPRPPRMPDGSALFCADQTGVVRQIRGGISLDCIKDGQVIR
jgi:hypothetical protein